MKTIDELVAVIAEELYINVRDGDSYGLIKTLTGSVLTKPLLTFDDGSEAFYRNITDINDEGSPTAYDAFLTLVLKCNNRVNLEEIRKALTKVFDECSQAEIFKNLSLNIQDMDYPTIILLVIKIYQLTIFQAINGGNK